MWGARRCCLVIGVFHLCLHIYCCSCNWLHQHFFKLEIWEVVECLGNPEYIYIMLLVKEMIQVGEIEKIHQRLIVVE